MKSLLTLIFIFCCAHSFSQDSTIAFDTVPPYQKDSTLPQFTILQTDSTYFTDRKLKTNEPVVLIYFSPTCGHCLLTAQNFTKKAKEFKNVQLVWISYYSVPEIKAFADTFFFSGFKNVHIGRDENYAVPSFFRVKFTPFMAIYDKQHHLTATFEKGTDIDNLATITAKMQ